MREEEKTNESSAGCCVTSRCTRPVQTTDDEKNHADEGLASVDNDATTKSVGGEGPDHDSKEVTAPR